jgi:hypothetical protein
VELPVTAYRSYRADEFSSRRMGPEYQMPRRKSHGVRTLQPVRTNELTPAPKVAKHTHGTQTAVAATHACDRRPTQTLQPSTSSQPFQRRTAGEKNKKNPPAPADLCAWLLGYGSSSDWLAVFTEPERCNTQICKSIRTKIILPICVAFTHWYM